MKVTSEFRKMLETQKLLALPGVYDGITARLSEQAENSIDKRREHRVWAYSSIATALTGVGLMTLLRED